MDMVPLGVRKGAWTEEEDFLLKKYVEKHGEGKWHQVPHKAGLNRCRKSCRLRWLNYLRPNIKRGNFTVDEVDLIIRLRKLLGNRWSLIAGRLPGRTSNDVKNYWNTYLHKKSNDQIWKDFQKSKMTQGTIEKTKVIRPQPRTLSKNLHCLIGKTVITDKTDQTKENFSEPFQTPSLGDDDEILWWDNMLSDPNINIGMMTWTNEEVIMEGGGEKKKSGMQGAGRDPFRLSERTSNDVKNYWNTHLHKKPNDQIREDVQKSEMTQSTMEKTKVIRPRPQTFSKNLHCLMGETVITDKTDQTKENFSEPFQTPLLGDDDGILWWDNILSDPDINIGMMTWTNEEVIMEGGGKKEKSSMQGAGRDPFRLPERTSNDIKNYWNTHLHKKSNDQFREDVQKSKITQSTMEKTKVIQPRPRTFSKNLPWLMGKTVLTDKTQTKENFSEPFQTRSLGDDDRILWWDNILSDPDVNKGMITWTNAEVIMEGGGEQEKSGMQRTGRDPFRCVQEDQSGWSDFFMDNMDLWDILGDDLR